jgi:hypothetical protein
MCFVLMCFVLMCFASTRSAPARWRAAKRIEHDKSLLRVQKTASPERSSNRAIRTQLLLVLPGNCRYTPTDMPSRDHSDGRSPGSRVHTFRRLPRTSPSGTMSEDSPFTVAGAAADLTNTKTIDVSPHSLTVTSTVKINHRCCQLDKQGPSMSPLRIGAAVVKTTR